MEKKEYKEILGVMSQLKDVPNSKLIDYMNELTTDFEIIKSKIISLTLDLDNVEILYNNILKEYQNRNNK